jgi:putative membrane protein insertion efficiency factor
VLGDRAVLELEVDAATKDHGDDATGTSSPSRPNRRPVGFSGTRRPWRTWPAQIAVVLIRLYQLTLSPLLGPHCRFAPSCSQYTLEAIARHGLLRGALLGARRLGRCHPFHEGGFDPVP